jgi:hypothetical protein
LSQCLPQRRSEMRANSGRHLLLHAPKQKQLAEP